MQKGRELEQLIEKVLDQLNGYTPLLGIRLEVKQIKRDGETVYTKKQPFDYMILGAGAVWAFDAKECSGETWYPSKAKAHQVEALHKVQELGHRAAFVVWFKKYRGLPGSLRWIEDLDRPATINSGLPLNWEMFLRK